ncbi:FAD-binding oxidoreductase [Variovorax ginsengisoli]|uniref:FAD/FMN-containing dehydrogenase n=1 Tax=Variovorax ginsengisoli TaxID=363844 RepID=A0ABT9S5W2_9BURK|nr:FAD-binding oxidoreductase [Variovorax ginsengisoli]MDP9899284.1 FAD/FMN-containing dehydrogenase [Variovorax ginsengisoli]
METLQSPVIGALLDRLGSVAVLSGPDIPERNTNDWGPHGPVRPLAVVRPSEPAGVAAAMQICHQHGIAVVPQGGLTGLCGGARPIAGAIALSLERLVGIEEIDPAASSMTVLAGTPLEVVQRAAEAAGFFMPLDLGARGSCAIGGNLSTNAGGNRVIRYGMARDMVLGIEVVLPDGTLVTSLNKLLKNNAGYDLKHLFIGSEGTLGIITRAVLRLHPKPASTMVAMCALSDYAGVLALLAAARRELGPLLSAFEVMWPDYWSAATGEVPNVRNPFAGDTTPYGAYVLVEALGTDPAVDMPRFEAWLERRLEVGDVPNAVVAQSMAEVAQLWGVRDACSEFVSVFGPHIPFDVGLPTGRMDEFAERCAAGLRARLPGCRSLYYGHIGDGNLHLVAWVPGAPSQPEHEIEQVVYGLVREFGGSVSAEHGIGTLKKPWLGHARSPEEIALMRTLKHALDPTGILNPGKVV